jgi:predicted acylesterase/phospholipase RssA
MVKHLVFAGGGPRAVSFLGAIEVLHKHNMINNVKHYWGNSAGALMAACMSLNTSPKDFRRIFYDMDFTKFRDFDINNIMSFSTRWGLDSGDAFTRNIKSVLETLKPGSSKYTLQELPGLHITATDLTDTKLVVLDSKSFPSMKLVDALRASTSLPFFYVPFRNPVNNHMYVDGAISCNFPWELLSKEEQNDAIGFDFCTTDRAREPSSLSEFIPAIMNFRKRSSDIKDPIEIHRNVIVLNIKGFPTWHLALTKEDRDELVKIGVESTSKWITSRSDLKTAQMPLPSVVQNIPAQAGLLDHKGVSSDNHESPSHLAARGSRPHLSLKPSPICRRWSL